MRNETGSIRMSGPLADYPLKGTTLDPQERAGRDF